MQKANIENLVSKILSKFFKILFKIPRTIALTSLSSESAAKITKFKFVFFCFH